jgi:hypothetical protein
MQRHNPCANFKMDGPATRPHLLPRSLLLAIVNTYCIVILRWMVQINIGLLYMLSVVEVFITLVYIIALFTWTLCSACPLNALFALTPLWHHIVAHC